MKLEHYNESNKFNTEPGHLQRKKDALIESIMEIWRENSDNDFSPKLLYTLSIEQLELIKKEHIKEDIEISISKDGEVEIEIETENDEVEIEENEENEESEESVDLAQAGEEQEIEVPEELPQVPEEIEPIESEKLYAESILKELEDKYLAESSIDGIRLELEDNKYVVYFDIKCETDVSKSTNEYNGIELKYNKICEIAPIDENYDEKLELINESVLSLHKKNYFKIKNNK